MSKVELKKLSKAADLIREFVKNKPDELHKDDEFIYEDLTEALYRVGGIVGWQNDMHRRHDEEKAAKMIN